MDVLPQISGKIDVESIPYNSEIYLDNIYVGHSPRIIYGVSPGSHTIKATLKGYNSDTTQIIVNSGQTVRYIPSLTRVPPPTLLSIPDPKIKPCYGTGKILPDNCVICSASGFLIPVRDAIQCGPCYENDGLKKFFCPNCWEKHRWSHGKSPAIGIRYAGNGTFSGYDGTEPTKHD